jgi:hypothetical protein
MSATGAGAPYLVPVVDALPLAPISQHDTKHLIHRQRLAWQLYVERPSLSHLGIEQLGGKTYP